jgi:HK97 family phage major capsid protein
MTAEDFQKAQDETVRLIKELRDEVDKKSKDPLSQEAIDKMNARLDQLDEGSQEITKKNLELAKKADEEQAESKERIDELEKKLLRFQAGGGDPSEARAEIKALTSFVTKGREGISPDEAKYLRTDVDTEGGYLAPNEYVAEIIKSITEISPVRSVARIRRTSSKAIEVPVRTGKPNGGWVGEGESIGDSNSTYGMLEIPANKLKAITIVTVEQLNDAAFAMETEIDNDIIEELAQIEGAAFVNGDAHKKPRGIMVHPDIASINSGLANAITADSLIDITSELKDGYMGSYMFNRRTLGEIRKLKDGQGQYLFQAGNLAAGMPNTINGFQYISAIDMPDIAANALPVAFGDFARGYTIVDNVNMTFTRDPYTLADQDKVRIIVFKRTGGDVTQPEAIKHLKIAV